MFNGKGKKKKKKVQESYEILASINNKFLTRRDLNF